LWAARRVRRGGTRLRLYLLVGLGFVVGAHNLVLAATVVHPLRPVHLVTIILLDVAGLLAFVLNVALPRRLARDEDLLRVLSHGHLDTDEPATIGCLGRCPRGRWRCSAGCAGGSPPIASPPSSICRRTRSRPTSATSGRKLGVSSRADAVGWAVEAGIYDPDTGRIGFPTRRGRTGTGAA
jgi:hypothetical protein